MDWCLDDIHGGIPASLRSMGCRLYKSKYDQQDAYQYKRCQQYGCFYFHFISPFLFELGINKWHVDKTILAKQPFRKRLVERLEALIPGEKKQGHARQHSPVITLHGENSY